jgi:molecular chaperone GrpE
MSGSQSCTNPDDAVTEAGGLTDVATEVANPAKADPALQARIDELQDRLIRSQADFENVRRRMQRDQDEARRYESLRLIRDLLPAMDGLARAAGVAEQTGDMQSLLDGIRMVSQQFREVLKQHSAEPIEALGKLFDPNIHEALTQVPTSEHPPMTVVQVVEQGYRLHDRVVRPARVIVACAVPEPDAVN